MTGYVIPDEPNLFVVEDYEYGVQSKWGEKWSMISTNHFNGWYPSKASANNALAQVRSRGAWRNKEYRLVRRPFGRNEVV